MQRKKVIAGTLALSVMTGATGAQEAQVVTQPAAPGGMMDRAADVRAPVYVDDSFASLEKIRTAARYERQNQSRLAIETYQHVVDEFGQKLIFLSDNRYVSLAEFVRGKLLAMPAVQQGEYDQLFGPAAQSAIAEAFEQNDEAKLRMACDRYFPASAAVQGVDQAARIAFERGAFATAARLWESLLEHPKAKDQRAALIHHAAVALHLSGQDRHARELREKLAQQFPDVREMLGLQEQNLLADLDRQLQATAPGSAPIANKNEWPMFMGNAARNGISDAHAQAGARLWSYRYRPQTGKQEESAGVNDEGNVMAMRAAMMRNNNDDSPGARGRPTFPVVSNGRLFVHSGTSVTALNLSSSQELWEYPADADRAQMSPAAAARAMAMSLAGTFNHDSCAVSGDAVFANLPGESSPSNRRRAYGGAQAGRVVALSAKDGAEIWSTSSTSLLQNAAVALVGSPLATSQGVFVLGRKIAPDAFSQLYLFRLDTRTGEVQWSAYVCSASVGGGYMPYGMSLPPAMLAFADDTVYVSSGQSAVCAVDASLGRILWLNITDAAQSQDVSGMRALSESWRVNAPLVWGDRVIMAEPGSPIRIFDRATGRLIGSPLPVKDYGELVAGISGDTLVTVGTRVCFYSLATGHDVLSPVVLPPEGNRIAGRPFMTRDQVYVPMEKGLAIVPLNRGTDLAYSAWPMNEDDRPGEPGNLLVTDQQIIVADGDEISWYSQWETARDYRLDVIRQKPQDPGAHMDLAEVAFRTKHYDLARDYTAKAIELAAAKSDDANEIMARIYGACMTMAEQSARATPALMDQARFFYEQCKASARGPAANAQWRIRLAQLSQSQDRLEETAALYSQILADPALRSAAYQAQNQATRAGVVAEAALRTLIDSRGRQLYVRFEEQAAAALRQARQAPDANNLQNILDSYPNSRVALQAAGDLAEHYQKHNDSRMRLNTLHWLYAHADEASRAGVIAQIALTHADLHRWASAMNWATRGERRFPQYRFSQNGSALSFQDLTAMLRKSAPTQDRISRAQFVLPKSDSNITRQIASGTLLSPLDNNPELQSPEYLLYLELGGARATKLKIKSTATPDSEGRTCELPEAGPAALLGVSRDLAILSSQQTIVAVNLKSAVIEWKIELRNTSLREAADARRAARMAGIQQQDDMVMAMAESANYDPDLVMIAELRRINNNLPFAAVRILGDRLLIARGGGLGVMCYNLATGVRMWGFDSDTPAIANPILTGNDQYIVLQGESPDRGSSTFTVINADNGKLQGTLKLPGRVIWRAISDENVLYAATGTGVVAYNVQGNLSMPLWRRDDLKLRQGTAAVLTLDGLVVVSRGDEMYCLSHDGGESRWPDGLRRLRNASGITPGAGPAVRVINDGDQVLVQTSSPAGIAAYRTDTGSLAWEASLGNFDAQSIPAFRSQPVIGDRFLVQLAQGDVTGRWSTAIYVLDRAAEGKLLRTVPLFRSLHDREGPRISRWTVTNAGVAFEYLDKIYLYGATGAE